MLRNVIILAGLGAALCACGGGSDGSTGTTGSTGNSSGATTTGTGGTSSTVGTTTGTSGTSAGACSVSLTGAVTGTLGCQQVLGQYNKAGGVAALTLVAQDSSSNRFETDLTITGELQPTTYTASASTDLVVRYQTPASEVWTVGGGNGSATLTFSSVTTQADTASSRIYTVHGTVDATLVPQADGGSITAHVTF